MAVLERYLWFKMKNESRNEKGSKFDVLPKFEQL